MVLRARDIMTTRVVTVRADAPLVRAEALLSEYRFSALPVLDRTGRLVGMISVIDILSYRADPDAPPEVTVGDVMSPDVLSMRPDANVKILTHRLRTYGDLRVMPIAERGHLVGVVTRSDLLRPRHRPSALSRATHRILHGDPERTGAESAALVAARRRPRPPVDWSKDLTAADVMTSHDLVTIEPSASVETAIDVLTGYRFTSLPVVDVDGYLLGIISEADLLRDPLDGRQRARARTVGGAMTTAVITAAPTTPLRVLVGVLLDHGLRMVPIVDARLLVGVVSRSDLL